MEGYTYLCVGLIVSKYRHLDSPGRSFSLVLRRNIYFIWYSWLNRDENIEFLIYDGSHIVRFDIVDGS